MTITTDNFNVTTTGTDSTADNAPASPAPTAEWVEVTDVDVRRKHVIPNWPLEVKSRDSVYKTVKVWLPHGWGAHDQVREGKRDDGTKQFYMEFQGRRVKTVDAPDDPRPQVPLPAEYEGLDEAGYRSALAALLERNERTIMALHQHATDRRMCGTFDSIMRQAGWPGRPKNYVITVKVSGITAEYTAAEFRKKYLPYMNGKMEMKRGERISVTEEWTTQVRATSVEQPKKTDNILDYVSFETLMNAFRNSYGTALADKNLTEESDFKIVEAYE